MKSPTCPNCGQHTVASHPETGCALATLIQVIRERGDVPERKLRTLHARCDVDYLWTALGPVLDGLETGQFSPEAA